MSLWQSSLRVSILRKSADDDVPKMRRSASNLSETLSRTGSKIGSLGRSWSDSFQSAASGDNFSFRRRKTNLSQQSTAVASPVESQLALDNLPLPEKKEDFSQGYPHSELGVTNGTRAEGFVPIVTSTALGLTKTRSNRFSNIPQNHYGRLRGHLRTTNGSKDSGRSWFADIYNPFARITTCPEMLVYLKEDFLSHILPNLHLNDRSSVRRPSTVSIVSEVPHPIPDIEEKLTFKKPVRTSSFAYMKRRCQTLFNPPPKEKGFSVTRRYTTPPEQG